MLLMSKAFFSSFFFLYIQTCFCKISLQESAEISLTDLIKLIHILQRFLKTAKHLGDKSCEGDLCGCLGEFLYRLGDVKTAVDYSELHLRITKELGDKSGEGKAYDNLGNAYDSLGDFKKAVDYYERHMRIAKELGDKSKEGKAYGNLGNAYDSLGDFKTAIDYHKRHLKIAKELGDRSGEGNAYGNLGDALQSVGDFKTAIDYYERSLKIARELGKRSGEGNAYDNLGKAHHSLGDFKTAVDYYQRYLKIAIELGDRSDEGITYGNLGNAHYSLGNVKIAIDYYERYLKIAKELGDRSVEGNAYGILGDALQRMGDFKTAIDYYQGSLKIARELGNKSVEGKTYLGLGNAHRCLGNFKIAIENLEGSLKSAKELGDRKLEGKTYCSLGNAHINLGDFKAAIDYYQRYLKIAEELGDRSEEGKAYGSLGNAHLSLRDFKTATDSYERHLKIAKELGDRYAEGYAYGSLGNLYSSLGNFKMATDYHERQLKIAEELGDRSGEENACGNLGITLSRAGDFKTAIDYQKRCLKIAKELNNSLDEGVACYYLGSDLESIGQVSVAIQYYQTSISLLNGIRDGLQFNDGWKISLRDKYQNVYAALWRVILADGKVKEALFSAEQGRAQSLKDLMALNYLFDANDAVQENSTFDELSSHLPLNTIFMAFGEKELVIWVCRKGKEVELRRKENSSQDEIETFFQSQVDKIGARDNVECEDRSLELARDKRLAVKRSPQDGRQTQYLHLQKRALCTLYDSIIDPIQDLFSGSELVFIPEGPLCLAPFAAFMSPDSKYLCETFRIRVAPSLTSLKMIAQCSVDYHHKSGVLLVGDPWVQDVTKLPKLPFARKEVEMIAIMLGCTPLIGRQATKDEVLRRLGSVALVHIAAHGNIESGEIALAPNSSEEDFILTMKDVKQVQLRARLVVLSCCHSARGEIKAEGVVGIARAFLGAGARSVLVSLWAIDDKATLEFMKNFYQHLVEGKSASEALNRAMNCMRESTEFSDVSNWAPFVLIGDDVTLEFDVSN